MTSGCAHELYLVRRGPGPGAAGGFAEQNNAWQRFDRLTSVPKGNVKSLDHGR